MMIKKAVLGVLVALIVFFTLSSTVHGLEYDNDDEFIVSAGETVQGSFVISDISDINNIEITTSFQFIENLGFDNPDTVKLNDDSYLIKYDISVPEETEIGIYRTVITIKEGSEQEYLNVKLSVQKETVKTFYQFIKSINIVLFSIILLVMALIFIIWWWKTG